MQKRGHELDTSICHSLRRGPLTRLLRANSFTREEVGSRVRWRAIAATGRLMIRRALHLSIRSFADSRARNIDLHRARFRGWMILFLGNDSPSADERRRRWPRSRCPPSRPGATCCRQGCGGSCLASRGMKRHCRQNARSRSSPVRGRQSAKRGCDCCWDSGASTRSSWPSCPPPRKTSTTSGCGPRGASILREKAKEREREREREKERERESWRSKRRSLTRVDPEIV